MGEDLEQRESFLRLFVAMDVHQNGAGLPVLGNHDRFPLLLKLIEHLGGMRFDKADGLDLGGEANSTPPELNIVR